MGRRKSDNPLSHLIGVRLNDDMMTQIREVLPHTHAKNDVEFIRHAVVIYCELIQNELEGGHTTVTSRIKLTNKEKDNKTTEVE